MNALVWAGVVVIGGFGSVLRFVVDGAVGTRLGRALLAGTAAVGSYTTFSTWMFETQRLTEERQNRSAAINVIVSLVLGVAAAALGRWIAVHL